VRKASCMSMMRSADRESSRMFWCIDFRYGFKHKNLIGTNSVRRTLVCRAWISGTVLIGYHDKLKFVGQFDRKKPIEHIGCLLYDPLQFQHTGGQRK
ncbi:MAG TPA: hypothetical protein VIX17_01045, partial [Pyrinomonadaceae bacterium]